MSSPHRRPALALLALALAACPPAWSRRAGPAAPAPRDAALVVESHLWRNYQPRADRPDTSLAALFRLRMQDRSPLPAGVRVEGAVLRRGRETWSAVPRQEEPAWSPAELEVVARGGPPWAAGSEVDVTVEVRDARQRAAAAAEGAEGPPAGLRPSAIGHRAVVVAPHVRSRGVRVGRILPRTTARTQDRHGTDDDRVLCSTGRMLEGKAVPPSFTAPVRGGCLASV